MIAKRRIAFEAIALCFALHAAEASPEDLFGYGTRTSAMGATGTAHATGYEAAWHNPALASTIRTNKLTLGFGGATFSLKPDSEPLPAKGYFVGAEVPFPFRGVLENRFGASFAFYTPTEVIARARVLYPEKHQFPILDNRAQSLTVRLALGADIGWGLRAGIGVAALAEVAGTVVAAADASGRVATVVENQLVATYAPTFGLTYDLPWQNLRIGATYRGELTSRFAVVVDASKISTLPIPLFNISGIAQYDPAQLAAEIAHASEHRVLALQLVYKRWSAFPGLIEPTILCREGPGTCGLSPPKIEWEDTLTVRLGAEQSLPLAPNVTMKARGGAFLETSPLPSKVPDSEAFDASVSGTSTVPTRYHDATRLAFTAGVGVAIGRFDLDFFAQYHLLFEGQGHIKVFGLTGGVRF